MTVRVLIVDGHQLFADALALRLGSEAGFLVTGTAPSVDLAFQLVDERRPDVLVTALALSGRTGEASIRMLCDRYPDIPIVAVSPVETSEAAVRVVRAGAMGFVSMSATADEFVAVVRGVSGGEAHVPPLLLADVLRVLQAPDQGPNEWETRVARLTTRELEVLTLMVVGNRPSVIAEELFLSVNTVRTHLKKVFAKLEVHSSVEAVSVALKGGVRPQRTDEPVDHLGDGERPHRC